MKNELVSIIEKYEMGGGFERKYLSNGMEIGWGTDKNSTHSFCDFYEKHFSPYKNKEISILEIGCNYGCSAIMWHDFLPKSKLLLLDIREALNPKCWDIKDNNRFKYAICDAYDEDTPENVINLFPEGFDIIIDDGPHTLESQKKCIEYYFPMLKKGGTLCIEDVQNYKDFEHLEEELKSDFRDNINNFSIEKIDLRDIKNRYDDLIFVVNRIQ